MKTFLTAICGLAVGSSLCFSQGTFSVLGTPIPSSVAKHNYGNLPKNVVTYDLTICNASSTKQSVVSAEIYQALSNANASLKPIGRQVILATILRNQSHDFNTILSVALSAALTALSAWNSSAHHSPCGLMTASGLAAVSAPRILADLKPNSSANQLEQFETQALEPALVLDAGSCIERTVFAANSGSKVAVKSLSFHVR